MAITVDIDLGYEFEVKAPYKEVFELLADVPASASLFPKVDRLVGLGHDTYRWEMAKVGTPQIKLQTIYTSRYTADETQGLVSWTPVKGEGNAQVAGHWKLTDRKTSTALQFKVNASIELPLPGLMKMMVAPMAKSEFEKLAQEYIDNLIERFGGEV